MLIDFLLGKIVPLEHLAGMQHGLRERSGLSAGHTFEQNCHEPGRDLIVRKLAPRVAADNEFNFPGSKFLPIAFFADEVNQAHALVLWLPYCLADGCKPLAFRRGCIARNAKNANRVNDYFPNASFRVAARRRPASARRSSTIPML